MTNGYTIVAEQADAAALGEVVRKDGRVGLRFERVYPHPIERVWRAITESAELREWMPCDMIGERREGAVITLPFNRAEVEKYAIEEDVVSGRIEIWRPPSLFQWLWDTDLLRFELTPTPEGTRLVFTTWPESQDPDLLAGTAGGYHLCLAELAVLLDGHPVPSVVDIDTIAFGYEKRYRELVELG